MIIYKVIVEYHADIDDIYIIEKNVLEYLEGLKDINYYNLEFFGGSGFFLNGAYIQLECNFLYMAENIEYNIKKIIEKNYGKVLDK